MGRGHGAAAAHCVLGQVCSKSPLRSELQASSIVPTLAPGPLIMFLAKITQGCSTYEDRGGLNFVPSLSTDEEGDIPAHGFL